MIHKRRFILTLPGTGNSDEVELESFHGIDGDGGYTPTIAATGKTCYTLNSGELQKLIDENITSRLYKDAGTLEPGDKCAICTKKYRDSDKIKTLNACGHYFHARCISEKIKQNQRICPECSQDFTGALVGSIINGGSSSRYDKLPSTISTAPYTGKDAPGTTEFYTNYYRVNDNEAGEDEEKGTEHQEQENGS